MKKLIEKYDVEIFSILFLSFIAGLSYYCLFIYKYEPYEIGAIYRDYNGYFERENPFEKNYKDYIMLDYKDGFVKMKNIETGEIRTDEDMDLYLTKIENQ